MQNKLALKKYFENIKIVFSKYLFSKYFLSVTLVHCIQTAKDSLPSDIILGPVAPSINFWKRSYPVSKNLVC